LARKNYSTPKEVVEKEIWAWSTDSDTESDGASSTRSTGMVSSGQVGDRQLYDVTCAICAKETQVPFKPVPGRPVYCKDCHTKIEKGQLKPVFAPKTSQNKVAESTSVLATLGIEFESSRGNISKPTRETRSREGRVKGAHSHKAPPSSNRPPLEGANSLREALKEVLGERGNQPTKDPKDTSEKE